MEPIIKYESCEELYAGPATMQESVIPDLESTEEQHGPQMTNYGSETAASLKRSYNETIAGGVDNSINNYHQGNQMPAEEYSNFYVPTAAHLYQPHKIPAGSPLKRYRRGESTVLFGPPFFELQTDYDSVVSHGAILARCLSCQVILRGHKNVSSNFIKHMKRVHPEMYKVYENIKVMKFRGFTAVEKAQIHHHNAAPSAELPTADHGYFDAKAFLENMSATMTIPPSTAKTLTPNDEEHNSETTETSETPPNSAGAIETGAESSTELEEHSTSDSSKRALDTMSKLLDEKLKAFVTKTEFDEAKATINDLVQKQAETHYNSQADSGLNGTSTSSPSPVMHNASKTVYPAAASSPTASCSSAMQMQLNVLEQECKDLRKRMQLAQQSKCQLYREMESIDRTLRQRKLIVRNLKLEDTAKAQESVEEMFKERLDLGNISLRKVNILPNFSCNANSKQKTDHNKYNLLVELEEADDAKGIFRNAYKLKGSGIFIEAELSHLARKRKEKLLVLRRELLRRNSALKVIVRNTQLLVCDKAFYWDEVEGLCILADGVKNIDAEEPNAVQYLKTITNGLDFTEFLNVLLNYDVQVKH